MPETGYSSSTEMPLHVPRPTRTRRSALLAACLCIAAALAAAGPAAAAVTVRGHGVATIESTTVRFAVHASQRGARSGHGHLSIQFNEHGDHQSLSAKVTCVALDHGIAIVGGTVRNHATTANGRLTQVALLAEDDGHGRDLLETVRFVGTDPGASPCRQARDVAPFLLFFPLRHGNLNVHR